MRGWAALWLCVLALSPGCFGPRADGEALESRETGQLVGGRQESMVLVHLGDSITSTGYLKAGERIEAVLAPMLAEVFPGRRIEQQNLGLDGEDVQHFLAERYDRVLRAQVPWADVFVIRYGTNDQHHYDAESFRRLLGELLDRLKQDYPGARLVLGTGPYLGGSAWVNEHQYAPTWQVIRDVAGERGVPLVDLFERFRRDYEERGRFLCREKGDMHPAAEGVRVMAQEILRTVGRACASSPGGLSPIHPDTGVSILLLGDSISAMHRGEDRLEAVLQRKLAEAFPQGQWSVANESRGGEWIGPGSRGQGAAEPLLTGESEGRYFEIRTRVPKADVVFVEYGANDSKCYPPEMFRQRLAALCERFERDYPEVRIVLATGMHLDYPKHARAYWMDNPQVPGWKPGSTSRNEYLAPYFEAIRALARERACGLADICLAMRAETAAGNWDLRIRNWPPGEEPTEPGGPVPPEVDAAHAHVADWFDNVHPNYAGTGLIAEVYGDVLAGLVHRRE
jgi:lysophospholipase L1-like esterase